MRTYCRAQGILSMLCGDLSWKEFQKRGDMCIHIADSLCCTVQTNTIVENNYIPIKIVLKKNPSLASIALGGDGRFLLKPQVNLMISWLRTTELGLTPYSYSLHVLGGRQPLVGKHTWLTCSSCPSSLRCGLPLISRPGPPPGTSSPYKADWLPSCTFKANWEVLTVPSTPDEILKDRIHYLA